jgi:hypothetical protein
MHQVGTITSASIILSSDENQIIETAFVGSGMQGVDTLSTRPPWEAVEQHAKMTM